MTRHNWHKLGKIRRINVKRGLEDRIVFCVNCDANRTLSVSSCGNLTCSSCSSENWMYISVPIAANFKEYNEQQVRERLQVDRYINRLERDVFFTPNAAMV